MGSSQKKKTVCYHVGQWTLPGLWELLGGHKVLLPDVPHTVKAAASRMPTLCWVTWAELYSEEWTAQAFGVGWNRGKQKVIVGMASGD